MREIQKCRQLMFQCHVQKTWESIVFFIKAGSYITAVSPHFLLSRQLQTEKVSTIWVLENSVGTFLKTLLTPRKNGTEDQIDTVRFAGIQDSLKGYRVNLPSESGSYSEMTRYVRDQRYQRRAASIVAVSPPIPGRSLCVYILRNDS